MSVVQLANFPLREIVTGGQIRVDRLGRLIDRLGGDRRQLCVTPHRDDVGADDIALDAEADRWVMADPQAFELRLADAVQRDPALRDRLAARLHMLAPDVLWCEQPFLWPLVAPSPRTARSGSSTAVTMSNGAPAATSSPASAGPLRRSSSSWRGWSAPSSPAPTWSSPAARPMRRAMRPWARPPSCMCRTAPIRRSWRTTATPRRWHGCGPGSTPPVRSSPSSAPTTSPTGSACAISWSRPCGPAGRSPASSS